MHHGLYSAVVQSLQHYERLQSNSGATSSTGNSSSLKVIPHGCQQALYIALMQHITQHLIWDHIINILLCFLQASEAAKAGYNPETVLVGRALQKDFEQRGVHLDSHGQSQALQMSEDIATLGMQISKYHWTL